MIREKFDLSILSTIFGVFRKTLSFRHFKGLNVLSILSMVGKKTYFNTFVNIFVNKRSHFGNKQGLRNLICQFCHDLSIFGVDRITQETQISSVFMPVDTKNGPKHTHFTHYQPVFSVSKSPKLIDRIDKTPKLRCLT